MRNSMSRNTAHSCATRGTKAHLKYIFADWMSWGNPKWYCIPHPSLPKTRHCVLRTLLWEAGDGWVLSQVLLHLALKGSWALLLCGLGFASCLVLPWTQDLPILGSLFGVFFPGLRETAVSGFLILGRVFLAFWVSPCSHRVWDSAVWYLAVIYC